MIFVMSMSRVLVSDDRYHYLFGLRVRNGPSHFNTFIHIDGPQYTWYHLLQERTHFN
jgi:hypothetical protein